MNPQIRSVAVVGASGQMGGLLVERCRATGLAAAELNRPLDDATLAGLKGADLVLLSVPIGAMAGVLDLVAPLLGPEQILADVCSVKERPLELMLAAHPGPVVGTHPLFGPSPPVDPRVAVTPGRGDAEVRAVSAFMERLGFEAFTVPAATHDRAMAFIQGLNFVTTVSYLSCMAGDEDMRRFVTPSFERRLTAAEKMLTMDGGLFEAIFESNPFSQEAVRVFRSHLNLAAGGDVDLLLQRAGWWWREGEASGDTD